MTPTLPTNHSNGTSIRMLLEGYDPAAEALTDFIDAWGKIEFNARDYYVNGPECWPKALAEREEINRKIRDVRDYIQGIREYLYGQLPE